MKLIKDLGMLKPKESSKQFRRYGIYQCPTCGDEFKTLTNNVVAGTTSGCKKCAKKTHGLSRTKIYSVWGNEIRRCTNSEHEYYNRYGGRGISVSEEFMKFDRWMKYISSLDNAFGENLSIDRIDNDGNYERGNLRWATRNVQSRNTRKIYDNNTSGYRGVSKNGNRHKAQIYVDKKPIYLGSFTYPYTAAYIYDSYIIVNNLEHTRNFA